jgi:hypothetical protein
MAAATVAPNPDLLVMTQPPALLWSRVFVRLRGLANKTLSMWRGVLATKMTRATA